MLDFNQSINLLFRNFNTFAEQSTEVLPLHHCFYRLNRKKREDKPPTDPGIPPPKVDEEDEEARGARKFCEKGGGV